MRGRHCVERTETQPTPPPDGPSRELREIPPSGLLEQASVLGRTTTSIVLTSPVERKPLLPPLP